MFWTAVGLILVVGGPIGLFMLASVRDLLSRVLVAAALAIIVFLFFIEALRAADCPQGSVACKVLVLTQEEERALIGILDTAKRARHLDLADTVNYFVGRLGTAPAGNPTPSMQPGQK